MKTEREWCRIFRAFSNLKVLLDDYEFVKELSGRRWRTPCGTVT
jgi:hypothetical protein